jgi:hypothetical protein
MNKKFEAKLQWLKPDQGGCLCLPVGPKYVTVVRFGSKKEAWLKEAWSLVLEFKSPPNDELEHQVEVSFLMPEGPNELLVKGSEFELMEGAQVVARGMVI